ncbi:hypothetical protein H9P43_002014 [Blastocladiella emersonii ATCC 22665]|nr:hypothetical protein H9P43_002014 [Blastocladiella emersonii ATCC 22665]
MTQEFTLDSKAVESGERAPQTWTDAEEAAAVRKVDWRILPFLAIIYLMSFLDRANIANARVANKDSKHDMGTELGLTDSQAQLAVSAFFWLYVALEVPSNLMLKRATPRVWISRIMITWGACTMALGAANSPLALILLRLALGAAEAGLFPSAIFYLTFWYRPIELSWRIALFYCTATLSGFVGAIVAYLITMMNGFLGLAGWRWIFILEGLPTVLLGIFCLWYLPSYPETSEFLSDKEREIIVNRLKGYSVNKHDEENFNLKSFIATVTDIRVLSFCVAYVLMVIPLYSFTFCFPTILSLLGYKDLNAQVMNAPLYFCAFLGVLASAWYSDKMRDRSIFALGALAVSFVGYIGLTLFTDPLLRYFSGFLCVWTYVAVGPFLTWLANTNVGSTRAAAATAMVIGCGNIGGIIAPYLYPIADKPLFRSGNIISLVCLALSIAIMFAMRVSFRREGKQI